MLWLLMKDEELHVFGIVLILPYLEKEGLEIEQINPDLQTNPQTVG